MPPLPFKLPSTRFFLFLPFKLPSTSHTELFKLFDCNKWQIIFWVTSSCVLKLSHTIYFVLEWPRASSKYLCIYAQMSHISADIRIRTFLRKNREQSFLFFAIKVQCAVIAIAQFFLCCCFRVWYLFDQCYPACALCVICFVRGLQLCALCNAHRQAAVMREPLALLASTLPISQLCSDSAKQGCN